MEGVVVVTGSSRGIGAETARLLARNGHAVCVNYQSAQAPADALVAQIGAEGGRAIAVQADVADADDVERLFTTIDQRLGRLTGLVNNAGITGRGGALEDFDAASARRVFEVNVIGTLQCTRAALRRMAPRHGGAGGAIVNISSISAQTGAGGMLVPYAASKAAVNTMTVGLARELAGDGIRVNAVMPGVIDTEIHAHAGLADRMPALLAQVPLKRMGQPRECAEAVAWLLSAQSSYVTGIVLPVAGGR